MENLTPAMKQYMQIKNKYKDCIVFFRMGDFYETFYEDAKTASKALDITLTRRGSKNPETSIPLAGIPYHALDNYLLKMIKQGLKVVIVEQLEDPKLAKGVVKRDVVRIVTPGTVIEQNILGKNNNYLSALSISSDDIGLSFIDISTGEFFTTIVKGYEEALNELMKYAPSEIILPGSRDNDANLSGFLKTNGFYITYRDDVEFYFDNAKETIEKQLKVASLDGFGLKNKELCVSSSGALLSYLYETQRGTLEHINHLKYYSNIDFLEMDNTTIRNLELVGNLREGTSKGTLLSAIDRTLTSMGARLLKRFILKPLTDLKKIDERLNSVDELKSKHIIAEEIRDLLKNISDVERLVSRVNLGNANPRDLIALQGSLELVPELKKLLAETESELLAKIANMENLEDLARLIDDAIADDPPAAITEGRFVKEGYDSELDSLRDISTNSRKIISDIEEKEKAATGIKSLKIRYNRVFGYYIDITRPNLHLAPQYYIKKQTLVNSERFITPELKELEEKILTAEEKMVQLETEIFLKIIEEIKKETKNLQKIADNIAYLDVLCSFSSIALKNNYVKPEMNTGYSMSLEKSRHPVVETITSFVDNNLEMDEDNRVMIITGPNMAGKSVFMRQIALNVIMAQSGCFVPCSRAKIGIISKIFCRTGASDDISSGQSTFMVEMSETAQILNGADRNSLIVLDEIGRGTSTFDGVSIAWAVAEYIASKIQAKTMFATHYHILNDLQKTVKGVNNYNIAVKEKDDRIIFLRKIIKGGTDKSYGIHVAKLAGMPNEVIEKSREIQFRLEQEDNISEKIIIETRKYSEKDRLRKEVEDVDRLVKSKQMTLDEI